MNQRAFFEYIVSNGRFSLYLELLGANLIFANAFFSVLAPGGTHPTVLGLTLTFSLQVTSILGFSVRSVTELEAQVNSVERLDYYGRSQLYRRTLCCSAVLCDSTMIRSLCISSRNGGMRLNIRTCRNLYRVRDARVSEYGETCRRDRRS